MIPKVIHYCWFGKGDKPVEVERCISTWRSVLPDYEIKEWNERNFDYKSYRYCREAYYLKKYAFVSDICRLYALFKEGGIYLDTDIEVLKTFDPFLSQPSFVGLEVDNLVGTGVIGAEKGAKWISVVLDSYIKEGHFILLSGQLDLTPNTVRITNIFKTMPQELIPSIYPIDYFCAKHWKTKALLQSSNTVCIHHYQDSWNNNILPVFYLEQKICAKLHVRNLNLLARLLKKYIAIIS